mgnify:FL=1
MFKTRKVAYYWQTVLPMSREKRNHWLSVILVNVIILILMHFLWPVRLLVPILSALVMLLVLYVTVKFIMMAVVPDHPKEGQRQ